MTYEEQPKESLSDKFKRTGALPKPGVEDSAPSVASILTGTLKEKSISWLLQAADHYEATGRLHIGSAAYTIIIEFGLGRPINARSPLHKGTEAILEVFTLPDGKVYFQEGVQPEAPTVEDSVHQIIKQGESFLENMRFLESYAISEVSFLQRAPGRLSPEELEKRLLEGLPLGLTVQKEFYGNVYGTLNIKDVADKMGLSQARWMAIVVNMLKIGLFLTPEGQSVVNAEKPVSPGTPGRDVLPKATGESWMANSSLAAPAAAPGIPSQPFNKITGEAPVGTLSSLTGTLAPPPEPTPAGGIPQIGTLAPPAFVSPAPPPPASAPPAPPSSVPPPPAPAQPFTAGPAPLSPQAMEWNPTPTGSHQILPPPSPGAQFPTSNNQVNTQTNPVLDAWTATTPRDTVTPPAPPQDLFNKIAEGAVPAMNTPTFPSPNPMPAAGSENIAPAPAAVPAASPAETLTAPAPGSQTAPDAVSARAPAEQSSAGATISLGVPQEEFTLDPGASEATLSLLRRKDTSILRFDAFQYFLEREFASAYRFGSSFTLILFCVRLEIDPTSTLPAPALSMITEAVDRIKREVDILGHFSDKAFGIILPNVAASQACHLADRITVDLPKMAPGLLEYRPIIHFGIASVPQDATELLMLVTAARKAMLEAAGRNASRVMFQEITG